MASLWDSIPDDEVSSPSSKTGSLWDSIPDDVDEPASTPTKPATDNSDYEAFKQQYTTQQSQGPLDKLGGLAKLGPKMVWDTIKASYESGKEALPSLVAAATGGAAMPTGSMNLGDAAQTGVEGGARGSYDMMNAIRQGANAIQDNPGAILKTAIQPLSKTAVDLLKKRGSPITEEEVQQAYQRHLENRAYNRTPGEMVAPELTGKANSKIAESVSLVADPGTLVTVGAGLATKTVGRALAESVKPSLVLAPHEVPILHLRKGLTPIPQNAKVGKDFATAYGDSFSEIYLNDKNVKTVGDLAKSADDVRLKIGAEMNHLRDLQKAKPISTDRVHDAMMKAVNIGDNKNLTFADSAEEAAMKAVEADAAKYKGQTTDIETLQKRETDLNNKLNPFYNKSADGKATAMTDLEKKAVVAARDEISKMIDEAMQEVGGERGASLRKAYRGAKIIRDHAEKKFQKLLNQAPAGLLDQLYEPNAVFEGAAGLAIALSGHPIAGITALAGTAGKLWYKNLLKELNSANGQIARAYGAMHKLDRGTPLLATIDGKQYLTTFEHRAGNNFTVRTREGKLKIVPPALTAIPPTPEELFNKQMVDSIRYDAPRYPAQHVPTEGFLGGAARSSMDEVAGLNPAMRNLGEATAREMALAEQQLSARNQQMAQSIQPSGMQMATPTGKPNPLDFQGTISGESGPVRSELSRVMRNARKEAWRIKNEKRLTEKAERERLEKASQQGTLSYF